MSVSTYSETNAAAQTVESYFSHIDGNFSVLKRMGDAFAPHEQSTPDRTMVLDAGYVFSAGEVVEVAAQTVGPFTLPSTDSRIDRVVVDMCSGEASIIEGDEAAAPEAPALPTGKLPIARVLLNASSCTIEKGMITDERLAVSMGSGRIRLLANLTIYVSTTGSDANDGLSASTPLATIQRAVDTVARNYDLNGHWVTIQLADGTYNQSFKVDTPWMGGAINQVCINGNAATPENVVISASPSLFAVAYARGAGSGFKIQNIRLEANTGSCICAELGSRIDFNHIVFGTAEFHHIMAYTGGIVLNNSGYTITGGARSHANGQFGGEVRVNDANITVTNTPVFMAFASATSISKISYNGCTFSGTATGPRYLSVQNSFIFSNGSGETFFPGDEAGTRANGGLYY